MSVPAGTPPIPLPRLVEPKLAPFHGTATADIKFIHFVGGEDDVDSKVWMVSIDGKYYALKIVSEQYSSPIDSRQYNVRISSDWLQVSIPILERVDLTMGQYITFCEGDPEPHLTPQEYLDYLDLFIHECRVYGRLQQEKREDVAVKAHGYILLTHEQEREVTEAHGRNYVHPETQADLGSGEIDRYSLWQRRGCHRHERLRAIVKDFVDERTPAFEKTQIPQMFDDMETLHSLGILIRDIHPGNYLGGKLVDFSCAITMYHPLLDRVQWVDLRTWRIEEFSQFNNMIVLWCMEHSTDFQIPKALEEWSGGIEDCGTDPCGYDWRKWGLDDVDEHGDNKADT